MLLVTPSSTKVCAESKQADRSSRCRPLQQVPTGSAPSPGPCSPLHGLSGLSAPPELCCGHRSARSPQTAGARPQSGLRQSQTPAWPCLCRVGPAGPPSCWARAGPALRARCCPGGVGLFPRVCCAASVGSDAGPECRKPLTPACGRTWLFLWTVAVHPRVVLSGC